MNDEAWFLLTTALGLTMAWMFLAWLFAKRIDNAGVVDAAWALGFALVGAVFFAIGVGAPERKLLIAVMVAIWSLRLGSHLGFRAVRRHPMGDPRTTVLSEQFPRHKWLVLFGFFELQAVLVTVLSVPFAMAASNPSAGLSAWEWGGAALLLLAVLGEGIADWQLERFRSRSENKGRTCRVGLWRFSRHPNYVFEGLVWVAFFLFALGTPHGWIAVFCPVLMLYSLLVVTGIPVTEAQALKSRGDSYREYQRTTSAFLPWFPRQ